LSQKNVSLGWHLGTGNIDFWQECIYMWAGTNVLRASVLSREGLICRFSYACLAPVACNHIASMSFYKKLHNSTNPCAI